MTPANETTISVPPNNIPIAKTDFMVFEIPSVTNHPEPQIQSLGLSLVAQALRTKKSLQTNVAA